MPHGLMREIKISYNNKSDTKKEQLRAIVAIFEGIFKENFFFFLSLTDVNDVVDKSLRVEKYFCC